MTRLVEPELLETLSEDHPDAIKSRQDLRLVNAIMRNHRWLISEVKRHLQPGWRVLEIGAGDGTLGRRLVNEGVCAADHLCGLDLVEKPVAWPAEARWISGDLLAQSPLPDAEIIITSLFLHHFHEGQLRHLGALLPPSCKVLIAAEPSRHFFHQIQGRLFATLTGMNYVTKYDMKVSIRAGFRRNELGDSLRLKGWQQRASTTAFGAYRFIATR